MDASSSVAAGDTTRGSSRRRSVANVDSDGVARSLATLVWSRKPSTRVVKFSNRIFSTYYIIYIYIYIDTCNIRVALSNVV